MSSLTQYYDGMNLRHGRSEPIPHADSAELGIIGCCLLGGLDTTLEALAKVPADAFSRDDCMQSWKVLTSMAADCGTIDLVRFDGEWGKLFGNRPPFEILDCIGAVPSAANLDYYTHQVNEAFRRRRLIFGAHEILNKAPDNSVTVAEILADLDQIMLLADSGEIAVMDSKAIAVALINHLEELHANAGKLSGVGTGIRQLDKITNGLQFEEMSIIASRPSMGKTSLGLNLVDHACLTNHVPTLIISLEMTPKALMRRMLAARQRVFMSALKSGLFTETEFTKITAFTSIVQKAPLHVIDAVSGMNTAEFKSVCMRETRKHGIKFLLLDYLQKMDSVKKYEKRHQEVREISNAIKAVAVKTGAAVVALAQLNRESERENRRGAQRVPQIKDLADSSEIEKDADLIAMIHRTRGAEKAQLIIGKQRDGDIGVCDLTFEGQFCRFRDADFEAADGINESDKPRE